MKFVYDDGGRSAAGYKGRARDCTVRAIAIATGKPYQEIYDVLFEMNRKQCPGDRKSSPRDGNTSRKTIRTYMESIGWRFVPTMGIGTGCKVHLRDGELPMGKLVVSLSRHMVAVIDGVIHDIFDPQREQRRCVYGYFVLNE